MSGHAGTDQVTAPAGEPGFDPDRQVQVPSLSFLPEGDGVVVGNAAADSYAVLPVDGAELLRRLGEGMTPRAAAAWYAETYGEEVDIAELLVDLADLGLVTLPDTTGPATPPQPPPPPQPHRCVGSGWAGRSSPRWPCSPTRRWSWPPSSPRWRNPTCVRTTGPSSSPTT